MRRLHFWLVLFTFGGVVVFSVDNDWDHFLSFLEAERRAWLLDLRPPVWSYQLCAGVTRIGDPQSFGLSPLFLPVLVLGSFWGAKALVVICAVIGYAYLAKLLDLLDPVDEGSASTDERRTVHSSLSLFYIFGGYFFWHLHVGHLTFALMHLLFMPVYYTARGCMCGLDRMERSALLLSAFTYCTAGVYHSVVFFVVPVVALLAISGVVHLVRTGAWRTFNDPTFRQRTVTTFGILGLALALSSYKWLAVLQYQLHFPRVSSQRLEETSSLVQLLVYGLIPVWNLQFGGVHPGWGPWAIYEYSAYSALPWIALALFCASLVKGKAGLQQLRPTAPGVGPELLLAFVLTILLCLGDSSPVPVHSAINRALYSNSVRVVGRYEIVLLFILLLSLLRAIASSADARRFYVGYLVPTGVVLTMANGITFLPYVDMARFRRLANAPSTAVTEMRTWHFVQDRVIQGFPGRSYMYETVLAGEIVPNCYQPLSMPLALTNETEHSGVLPAPVDDRLDLLHPGSLPVSGECRKSAYVTQNTLRFDPRSCPDDLCFHINTPNLYQTRPVSWNQKRGLYCVK